MPNGTAKSIKGNHQSLKLDPPAFYGAYLSHIRLNIITVCNHKEYDYQ